MRCNRTNHVGDRELSPSDFYPNGRCRACHQASVRRARFRHLGVPIDPPPGFVPIRVAAARLGIGSSAVHQRLLRGFYAGHLWRRGVRGMIYIHEHALNRKEHV